MDDNVDLLDGLDRYDEEEIKHYISVLWCHKVIREYTKITDMTPELKEKFDEWLWSNDKRREKDIAMAIIFQEMVIWYGPDITTETRLEEAKQIINGSYAKAD